MFPWIFSLFVQHITLILVSWCTPYFYGLNVNCIYRTKNTLTSSSHLPLLFREFDREKKEQGKKRTGKKKVRHRKNVFPFGHSLAPQGKCNLNNISRLKIQKMRNTLLRRCPKQFSIFPASHFRPLIVRETVRTSFIPGKGGEWSV